MGDAELRDFLEGGIGIGIGYHTSDRTEQLSDLRKIDTFV